MPNRLPRPINANVLAKNSFGAPQFELRIEDRFSGSYQGAPAAEPAAEAQEDVVIVAEQEEAPRG